MQFVGFNEDFFTSLSSIFWHGKIPILRKYSRMGKKDVLCVVMFERLNGTNLSVGCFPFTGVDKENSFLWPQKTNMTWSNSAKCFISRNEYIKFAFCKNGVQTFTYAINASLAY